VWRYAIQRLILLVPVLFGVTALVFSMLHIAPGDPIEILFRELDTGEATEVDEDTLAQLRAEHGLDQPLPIQYLNYVRGAVTGDLGTSIQRRIPVTELIRTEFPFTLELAITAFGIAAVGGLVLGLIAALRPGGMLDTSVMAFASFGVSMPNFWLGLLLMLIVSVHLGWLPVSGTGSWQQLVLPSLTLGTSAMAILARLTRSSLLETLNEDYVRTARAKGLRESMLVVRHALRNALIPVITVLGLQFGNLLGGALIVETVFARRGIGALTIQAILAKDFPLAQGLVLFSAVIYVLVNLTVDLLYGWIDPRISYS
jgi:peptide/nickel transport system permease protein